MPANPRNGPISSTCKSLYCSFQALLSHMFLEHMVLNLDEVLTQDGLHIKSYLEPRKGQLRRVTQVFGKPSDASRKKMESRPVPPPDGEVDYGQKERIFDVSDKFQIDEMQASILVRTFIYGHGLSGTAGGSLEAIATGLPRSLCRSMTRNTFTLFGSSFHCST